MPLVQYRNVGRARGGPHGRPGGARADGGLGRTVRYQTVDIAGGDAGIHQTAAIMCDLIRQGQGHPLVREHAERAVGGVPPGQPLAEVRAVYDYVGARTEYRRDPVLNEWIRTPWEIAAQVDEWDARRLPRRPQLDCDDLTVYSLALLASIGYDTAVRVVSTRPDRQYNHVYGMVYVATDCVVPLDLTRYLVRDDVPWAPETRAFERVA